MPGLRDNEASVGDDDRLDQNRVYAWNGGTGSAVL